MTKREITTFIKHYEHGLSKEICRTAIIQLCCPNLSRKELNKVVQALNFFEDETRSIDFPAGDYVATVTDIKPNQGNS